MKKESFMKKKVWWESLLVVILFWYPLRHIYWGLDLWDTGYNYANFAYMGLDHMDSMWLFSTYLANAAGHLLTMLPGAGGLVGMNLYTALFASALAIMGYFFCTRKLGISRGITFVGELAALSLCWCPTALIYNYLTYVLFLACVILLYAGLTENRMWCLFAAGICLGTNVLVRFSNLPEAAMIMVVWVYAFLAARKQREGTGVGLAAKYTVYCLGGYLAALAVGLGYLHIRYGLDAYVNGIMRLFAMTEDATDYKPASMLTGLIGPYRENLYWVVRIFVIVLIGTVGFAALRWILRRCGAGRGEDSSGSRLAWRIAGIGACSLAVLMLVWLYYRGFCSLEFYSYGAILRPGILFLMLTMGIAVIRIFYPKSTLEERLISGLVLLVVLLTSLGSNNGVYPSLNNLFVAAPYTLWHCQIFIQHVKEWHFTWVNTFPAKAILTAFLALFLFQSGVFGVKFVFAEATGARDITTVIENNEILRGVKMSPERAEWMSGISAYVEEQNLKGQEVILYGQIPALSYYLQMPSAFNPWSDLDSYQYEVMKADLQELKEEISQGKPCPTVILERNSVLYLQGGIEALLENGMEERAAIKMDSDRKLKLIGAYMEELNYELTYENAKFMLYQAK